MMCMRMGIADEDKAGMRVEMKMSLMISMIKKNKEMEDDGWG